MPIRGSPNGVSHPHPQVVAIARNGWSRSIGMSGRDQSESLVAIIRCAHPQVIGIDEIAIRKGHKYRIVVSDLRRGGRSGLAAMTARRRAWHSSTLGSAPERAHTSSLP